MCLTDEFPHYTSICHKDLIADPQRFLTTDEQSCSIAAQCAGLCLPRQVARGETLEMTQSRRECWLGHHGYTTLWLTGWLTDVWGLEGGKHTVWVDLNMKPKRVKQKEEGQKPDRFEYVRETRTVAHASRRYGQHALTFRVSVLSLVLNSMEQTMTNFI